MRFWRRRTFLINAGLCVLLAAGGLWAYALLKGDSTANASSSSTRTGAVQQGKVTATVTASGTVASTVVMNHNFVTAGTVTQIKVALGAKVTKGQVLAKVDDTETAATLATAKENLTAAKDALSRAKDEADDANVDYDDSDAVKQAQRTVNSAQNTVDSAQRAEDGTTLKAGMSGTVTALSGTVGGSSSGSSASSGGNGNSNSSSSSGSSAFIVISDMAKLQVAASVPESDATRLKLQQTAQVTWNALANTSVEGIVTSISPTSTTSGGVTSYPIVVSLDSVPAGAKLGQSVSLNVVVAEADDVLYVPAAAVKTTGTRRTVTVVTSTGAEEARPVEVGIEGDTYTEIKSGLELGEKVVIATVTTNTNTNQLPGGGQFPGGGFTGGGGGFTGGGNGGRTTR
jgi:macrolide-specific efflux system membrane fusion protein